MLPGSSDTDRAEQARAERRFTRKTAVLTRQNVRQSAVLDLHPQDVRDQWERATAGVDEAIAFLIDRCGVAGPNLIPYRAQLLVLGALGALGRLEDPGDEDSAYLGSWFWATSFSLAFEVAANTELVHHFRQFERPAAEKASRLPAVQASTLFEATRRRPSAIRRAFVCALSKHGAKDPLGGELRIRELAAAGESAMKDIVVVPIIKGEPPADYHLRVLAQVAMTRSTRAQVRTAADIAVVLSGLRTSSRWRRRSSRSSCH